MRFLSPFFFAQGNVFVLLLNWSGLWTGQVHTILLNSTVSENLKLFSQHMSSPRNASLPGCFILKPCSHEICWESTNSFDYLTALGNGTETRLVFETKAPIAGGGCRQIFEASPQPLGSQEHRRRGCPASLRQ